MIFSICLWLNMILFKSASINISYKYNIKIFYIFIFIVDSVSLWIKLYWRVWLPFPLQVLSICIAESIKNCPDKSLGLLQTIINQCEKIVVICGHLYNYALSSGQNMDTKRVEAFLKQSNINTLSRNRLQLYFN